MCATAKLRVFDSRDPVWCKTAHEMAAYRRLDRRRDDLCAGALGRREDASSMTDEIDPGQPFLRVNILRWREIFRMIETSSGNVDLIGRLSVS
jgi:hypothetical protein